MTSLHPPHSDSAGVPTQDGELIGGVETLSSKVSIFVARFTYKPAEMSPNPNYDQELAVTAGDYLYVYGDIDEDGFYHAQHQNGEVGMVPSNFVEKVPDEDGMLTDSRHKRIVSDGYIAETFAEESFCKLVENEIFCGETFADCSLVPHKDATPTNFLSQIATKP